ncbi:MAG: hypothetical protein EOO90_06345 [Pedobacter sp.]|nr:MAG: hypothetical protein EOO90_06345 [Pedobacter sp.]
MSNIKSLADQLRSTIADPLVPAPKGTRKEKKHETSLPETSILTKLRAFDNADHKSMVHVRFDKRTAQTLNHFKMATGIDVTKVVAFAVKNLMEQHSDIKSIAKQYIQNLEL